MNAHSHFMTTQAVTAEFKLDLVTQDSPPHRLLGVAHDQPDLRNPFQLASSLGSTLWVASRGKQNRVGCAHRGGFGEVGG
eukprot:12802605-Heterocapsa_arctica.AAC.1